MKSLILSLVLASTSVVAFAADNAPAVSGKWKIHTDVAGNESDLVCTFTQKDDDLTGSCTTESGNVVPSGKVDGMKVAWSYDSEYEGSPLTVKYAGTLDSTAKKMAGTVHVEPFSVDGDFTATPAKSEESRP